jgi:hypothetical protein
MAKLYCFLLAMLLLQFVKGMTEDDEKKLMDSLSIILKSDLLKGSGPNADAPKVIWPDKFSMKMETETTLYNASIRLKFDVKKNKMWSQLNYTSPIFGDFEAFQVALFPGSKNASLKIGIKFLTSR